MAQFFQGAAVKLVLAFMICGHVEATSPCQIKEYTEVPLSHAREFRLARSGEVWRISFPRLEKTLYIVNSEAETCHGGHPLELRKRFLLRATNELAAFELLESRNKIRGYSHKHFVKKRSWIRTIPEVGDPPHPELMLKHNINAYFQTPFDHLSFADQFSVTGYPLLDTAEKSPLARAEWLLYYAVLLNEWEYGQKLFEEVRTNYQTYPESSSAKKQVLIGHHYHGHWFVPGVEHDLVQMIKALGAEYVFQDLNGRGPYPVSFEEIIKRIEGVDLWLPQAAWLSYEEMKLKDGRHDFLIKRPNIKTFFLKSQGASFDFFERGPYRPDLVMEDLKALLNDEAPKHFFMRGDHGY